MSSPSRPNKQRDGAAAFTAKIKADGGGASGEAYHRPSGRTRRSRVMSTLEQATFAGQRLLPLRSLTRALHHRHGPIGALQQYLEASRRRRSAKPSPSPSLASSAMDQEEEGADSGGGQQIEKVGGDGGSKVAGELSPT